ncbi:MAG: MBL fold metallo-hydrolase [Lachnospiraceae bacterium]|nr:MBL fold metallo-hydrolase [Lachnospiraceae bacterium]
MKIQMLGTGNAMVTNCYNTCFMMEHQGEYLLVDAGGGNQILKKFKEMQLPFDRFHHMIVTHAHTDHILGVIWVIRQMATLMKKGTYEGDFTIYCHQGITDLLPGLCKTLLAKGQAKYIEDRILFDTVGDGDMRELLGQKVTFFDIHSTKLLQYGFRMEPMENLSDCRTPVLVCLGDEPYNAQNRSLVVGADYLMCEAFCLYEHRERYKPYEKHHSTALDAGKLAEELGIKNLILYHTEDDHLDIRKEAYTREAKENFGGNVFVPDDMEVLILSND